MEESLKLIFIISNLVKNAIMNNILLVTQVFTFNGIVANIIGYF